MFALYQASSKKQGILIILEKSTRRRYQFQDFLVALVILISIIPVYWPSFCQYHNFAFYYYHEGLLLDGRNIAGIPLTLLNTVSH